MNLPHNPDALKWSDSRAQKYVDEFGETAVELDSLHPEVLSQIVQDSIEEVIDVELYEEEKKAMETDVEAIQEGVIKLGKWLKNK